MNRIWIVLVVGLGGCFTATQGSTTSGGDGGTDGGAAAAALACVTDAGLAPGVDTTVPAGGGYGIDAPSDALRGVGTNMVGTWVGTQTNPWEPKHRVTVAFYEDGSYSASCDGGACIPFYYGESCPVHRGYWQLTSGDATEASGLVRIFFPVDGTDTSVVDLLHVRATPARLSFEAWGTDADGAAVYGPITFELTRLE